jgi:creatinine amidohydrolase
MLPKRNWSDMGWPDFSAGDTSGWIAVLPLAATEQHGPHLPVGVDTFIADAYLARVIAHMPADLPVTILPVQRIGQSDEHLSFPGTLTFSSATVIRAWTEICECVRRAGIRKLVMVTSHGGNVEAMGIVARDLRARLGMLAITAAWHRFGYPDGLFSADERRHGIHAGDIETSLVLAHVADTASADTVSADTVRMDRIASGEPATVAMQQEFKYLNAYRPAGFGWMSQDLDPSGAIGDPRPATAEKGAAALEFGARAFVELLLEVHRFDLDRLRDGPLDQTP